MWKQGPTAPRCRTRTDSFDLDHPRDLETPLPSPTAGHGRGRIVGVRRVLPNPGGGGIVPAQVLAQPHHTPHKELARDQLHGGERVESDGQDLHDRPGAECPRAVAAHAQVRCAAERFRCGVLGGSVLRAARAGTRHLGRGSMALDLDWNILNWIGWM